MNQTYRIFTDGSAIGNPGPGGWGAVVIAGKRALGDVRRPSLDDRSLRWSLSQQSRRFGRCKAGRGSSCTRIPNT